MLNLDFSIDRLILYVDHVISVDHVKSINRVFSINHVMFTGDDNVSLVNISVEKKKKEAALGEIELIGVLYESFPLYILYIYIVYMYCYITILLA